MDLGLAGRNAVVTGGSKGIGLAIVRGLAAAGARVTVGARKSSADLDELARTGQVRVVLADLADPAGPASLIGQAGAWAADRDRPAATSVPDRAANICHLADTTGMNPAAT
jgi:NAD(P)-dependent dehydrogenase (short-subunit alcohol dehydrogenase family)